MDKKSLTIGLFFFTTFLYQITNFRLDVFTWIRLVIALFFLVMSSDKIRNGMFDFIALVFASVFVGLVKILPTKRASDLRQRRVREQQKRSGANRW